MTTPPKSALGLPYSTFRQAGDFFYISGHTGLDIPSKTAATDITGQTKQLFTNLQETLTDAGLELGDIIKTTVFLTDMADFPAFNAIYTEYFNDTKPARSTVAAAELPRVATNTPLLVEIEAVAYKRA